MTTQEGIFKDLLYEANNFTSNFFPNFGKLTTDETIPEKKKSMLSGLYDASSKLKDTSSKLKKQFLEKIQPEGQKDKIQTKKEIDEQYEKFNTDIEARNTLLNADAKTKKEFEDLQKQIKENERKQSILEEQLKDAKETSGTVINKPGTKVDISDPGVILHTNEDVAKMTINIPDNIK